MFTLIDNVVDNLLFVANTTRKGAIFFSPSPKLWETGVLFCPLAASLLDVPHQIAQAHRGRQLNSNVYMIANAVNAQQAAIATLHD